MGCAKEFNNKSWDIWSYTGALENNNVWQKVNLFGMCTFDHVYSNIHISKLIEVSMSDSCNDTKVRQQGIYILATTPANCQVKFRCLRSAQARTVRC